MWPQEILCIIVEWSPLTEQHCWLFNWLLTFYELFQILWTKNWSTARSAEASGGYTYIIYKYKARKRKI